jgi:hypothetical protein
MDVTKTTNDIKVYQDAYANPESALLGFKGKTIQSAGVIFCPYVPGVFNEPSPEEKAHEFKRRHQEEIEKAGEGWECCSDLSPSLKKKILVMKLYPQNCSNKLTNWNDSQQNTVINFVRKENFTVHCMKRSRGKKKNICGR